MWIFVVRRMHPCGAWAPGRARKIDLKLTRGHFSQNLVNFGVMKNLCSLRDFAQGIESRQQMHSWIACYLREGGKLLRSDFFLEIDVIFAFLWSIYPTFWQPNWGQISPHNRITLRAGRALRVMWISRVEANAPLWCVSPRQGPKNWVSAHQKALFPKNCSILESWKIFPSLGISPKE